jgi:hypothetical protein
MTPLGKFLNTWPTTNSAIVEQTGMTKNRISQLRNLYSTRITGEEVYKIAKAINIDPGELLYLVCAREPIKRKRKKKYTIA